ncbi:MAG: hypothetical protein Q9M92_09795 [Enterobacterales bacterium]|nr:hypothetical protein [Enterobacterales bacterium]
MNLWILFPKSLLQIEGILYLPIFVIPFYVYVLYAIVKHPENRTGLIIFLVLTLTASTTMFLLLGPRIGTIFPPLILLSVMLMPLGMLTLKIWQKDITSIWVWGLTSVAGCLHSLSWAVWLFALAGS